MRRSVVRFVKAAENARTRRREGPGTTQRAVRVANTSDSNPDFRKDRFELLKLEYTKAAERYENIYKAIWQNFQYVVVAAAAVGSFGIGKIPSIYVLVGALTPLVFWFLATFLPMNHYGDQTRTRLARLEDELNDSYFGGEEVPRLEHFGQFRGPGYLWRVQHVVWIFGSIAVAGLVFSATNAVQCLRDQTFVSGLCEQKPASQFRKLVLVADSVPVEPSPAHPAASASSSVQKDSIVPGARKLPTSQVSDSSVPNTRATSSKNAPARSR